MDCLTQATPRVQSQFFLRLHRIPWDSMSFLRSEKSLSMPGLYIQLFWRLQNSINEYYIGMWPPCSCCILQWSLNCLVSLAKHHSCSDDQPDSLHNTTRASVTNNASSSLQRHYTATLAIQRHTRENCRQYETSHKNSSLLYTAQTPTDTNAVKRLLDRDVDARDVATMCLVCQTDL